MDNDQIKRIIGYLVDENNPKFRRALGDSFKSLLDDAPVVVPSAPVVPADPVGVRHQAEGASVDADHRSDNRETECDSIPSLELTQVATKGEFIACREKALDYLTNKYFRVGAGTYSVPLPENAVWSTVNELIRLKSYGYKQSALIRALARRLIGRSKYAKAPEEGSFLYKTGLVLSKTKTVDDWVQFVIE